MWPELSPPKRVLIIRLSAIGDVILSSGMVPVLRSAWPEAQIFWLTEDVNANLLSANAELEKLYVLPRGHWRRLWKAGRLLALFREVSAFIKVLRAAEFDMVLDIQGLLKSGLLAWSSGAPVRVGLGSKEGSQYLMTRVVSRAVVSHLPGKEYRALCQSMALAIKNYRLNVAVADAARHHAKTMLAETGVSKPFAVFCPFTTRPQKHWFDDHWIALAQRFRAELGLNVVFLGGPGDVDAANHLAEAAGVLSLAGKTSLAEVATIIEDARILVGVDTGLTHLGLAMSTPSLALFGSTRPYLETESVHAQVLYEPRACSPCRRRPTCGGTFDCMRVHSVEKVLHAAEGLLK